MKKFLETERLMLKLHDLSDLGDLISLRSDPDVMKYIGDGSIHTKEQVHRFLNTAIPYQEKHGIDFALFMKRKVAISLVRLVYFILPIMMNFIIA